MPCAGRGHQTPAVTGMMKWEWWPETGTGGSPWQLHSPHQAKEHVHFPPGGYGGARHPLAGTLRDPREIDELVHSLSDFPAFLREAVES